MNNKNKLKKVLDPDTYNKRLAEVLHTMFCTENHTDGCGWLYENDRENPWDEFQHKRWLVEVKVKKLNIDLEEAILALKLRRKIEKEFYKD